MNPRPSRSGRPTRLVPRLVAFAALLLPTVAVLASTAPAAHAETGRGQLAYRCDVTTDQNPDGGKATYSFTSALQVDVPASVRPGDVLPLSGTFSVQIPEEVRAPLAAYYSHIQVISDTVTIPVTVGGRTTSLRASRFDSGRVSTAQQPLVLSGTVSAAAFRVPAGATGAVRIELPGNGSVTSHTEDRPVAFNSAVFYSGGLVAAFPDEISGKVSCAAPDGADRTVASVPIARASTEASPSSAASTGQATPSAASDSDTPAQGASTAASAGTTADTTSDTTSTVPAAGDPLGDPFASADPAAVGGAGSPSTPAAVADGQPEAAVPSSGSDEIVVSDRALLAACALVVVAAFTLAGWSHHRVRLLRASIEG